MKLIVQILIIIILALLTPVIYIWLLKTGRGDARVYIAVAVIIICAVLLWLYETVLKPLTELKKGTKKIKEGDLDFTMESDSGGELGELVRSFDEMRIRLKNSQEEKIRTDQETRELVRNIAHDLKTPITTIRGYSEGIMDGVASSPEKQLKYLRTIHNKSLEMTNLIDELSFYSKVDSNRIPYNFKKISAKAFFDDCAEEISMELDAKAFTFYYEPEIGDEVRIAADPEQFKKVINNLVSNSVKYNNKPNGVIRIRLHDNGDFFQCDFEDNGRGVEKKDLSKIYDRFFRADPSRGELFGNGIGLSIVKKIVEDHGGRIWATGENGEGLCHHIILRKV